MSFLLSLNLNYNLFYLLKMQFLLSAVTKPKPKSLICILKKSSYSMKTQK